MPILFGRDSKLVEGEGKEAYENYDSRSMRKRIKRFLPLPNFIVARPTLHDRLRDSHVFGALPESNILNLGSGVQNKQSQGNLVNLDIYAHHNTDVAGDAHYLPFLNESMDGVWLCAVLEHLQKPFDVAAQVFRVLKPGGFVLVTVPFIQPRHGSPHDYFRYTIDGLRSVFKDFQEDEGGVTGKGPVGTWAEMTMALAGSLSRNVALSYGLRFFTGWLLYPLTFLDKILTKTCSNSPIAGGSCYLGTKP